MAKDILDKEQTEVKDGIMSCHYGFSLFHSIPYVGVVLLMVHGILKGRCLLLAFNLFSSIFLRLYCIYVLKVYNYILPNKLCLVTL